jgi:hypothetical protein
MLLLLPIFLKEIDQASGKEKCTSPALSAMMPDNPDQGGTHNYVNRDNEPFYGSFS